MEGDVDKAIATIRAGGIVAVVDDRDRENEGDLIMAAEAMRDEDMAFFLRHTSGVVCAALPESRARALDLPQMVRDNSEGRGTAFTISVDHRDCGTGISAADRALTIRALADPRAGAAEFVRPGHVFPLAAREGGVLRRAGHTEAALDLAQLSGRAPAGVLCEIVSPDKRGMATHGQIAELAAQHGLSRISVADLVRHRLARECLVERLACARLPTAYGPFECQVWRSAVDDHEHVALVRGTVDGGIPPLVRVHSECLTGDALGSGRCDCGAQLREALAQIATEGRGVLLYLRGQEGRGIGLTHKLRAYDLQDNGLDTVDANLALGLPVDRRDYGIGAQILRQLGVSEMRLLTNNPHKYRGLEGYGLTIAERVPLLSRPTDDNVAYLEAKRRRLGHHLPEAGLVR